MDEDFSDLVRGKSPQQLRAAYAALKEALQAQESGSYRTIDFSTRQGRDAWEGRRLADRMIRDDELKDLRKQFLRELFDNFRYTDKARSICEKYQRLGVRSPSLADIDEARREFAK